jgi:uncharacterized membrane protein YqgA involved in biofilm formation
MTVTARCFTTSITATAMSLLSPHSPCLPSASASPLAADLLFSVVVVVVPLLFVFSRIATVATSIVEDITNRVVLSFCD